MIGDDNITKKNNHSCDLWNKYAEMGRHDEQIRRFVSFLNENRDDFINDYKKISPNFLDIENSQLASDFEDFLNQRISMIVKPEKDSTNGDLIMEAVARHKVELFNYLSERREHNYLCKIKFEDGYALFKVFEALRKSNDMVTFRISSNCIHAYTTNNSKTYLIDIILKTDENNFSFTSEFEVQINLDALLKSLECNKSERIISNLMFKEGELEIDQYSLTHKSRISRIIKIVKSSLGNENILDELTELNHLGYFILDTDKFLHVISQAGRFNEGIKIELSMESIRIYDDDHEGNSEIRWEKKDLREIRIISQDKGRKISSYVPIRNLKKIIPFLFEKNALLRIYMHEEIPIKIHIDFNTLNKSYSFFFFAQKDANAYK